MFHYKKFDTGHAHRDAAGYAYRFSAPLGRNAPPTRTSRRACGLWRGAVAIVSAQVRMFSTQPRKVCLCRPYLYRGTIAIGTVLAKRRMGKAWMRTDKNQKCPSREYTSATSTSVSSKGLNPFGSPFTPTRQCSLLWFSQCPVRLQTEV